MAVVERYIRGCLTVMRAAHRTRRSAQLGSPPCIGLSPDLVPTGMVGLDVQPNHGPLQLGSRHNRFGHRSGRDYGHPMAHKKLGPEDEWAVERPNFRGAPLRSLGFVTVD